MSPADIDAVLARVPGWSGRHFSRRPAAPPVVSPMHSGVEGDGWVVDLDGTERFFVKVPAEDARPFVDKAAALLAARQAGVLGVAPPLFWSDPATGIAVWPWLEAPWRTALLVDLETPALAQRLVGTLRRLHAGPAFARTRSVFDLVETYAAEALARRVGLPADFAWMLDQVRDIAAAVTAAGVDLVPCHGDGIASNVMIGDGDAILLVDWDEAANADPFWDLGSLFAEAFPFDPQARAALEHYAGRCDEALLHRCRLYGIADDLAWATRSMIAASLTTRPDLEYFKYAQWRFLRCRMDLAGRAFEERLRSV